MGIIIAAALVDPNNIQSKSPFKFAKNGRHVHSLFLIWGVTGDYTV
jgi:hypothetical protein